MIKLWQKKSRATIIIVCFVCFFCTAIIGKAVHEKRVQDVKSLQEVENRTTKNVHLVSSSTENDGKSLSPVDRIESWNEDESLDILLEPQGWYEKEEE